MRRTRLVAATFAGTVCLVALAPVAVASEPVAEVSPRRVRPGGTVTIKVTCPKHGEMVQSITAYSQVFEDGEANLKLLRRGGRHGKPTYSGTARIVFAHHSGGSLPSDAYGSDDTYGTENSYRSDDTHRTRDPYRSDDTHRTRDPGSGSADDYGSSTGTDTGYGSDSSYGPDDSYSPGSSHRGKRYGINGSCPDGSDFTAAVVVLRKPHGGAHAGQGGSQGSVNTAAVAAGGALLSATVGFGVYVLRRRRPEL